MLGTILARFFIDREMPELESEPPGEFRQMACWATAAWPPGPTPPAATRTSARQRPPDRPDTPTCFVCGSGVLCQTVSAACPASKNGPSETCLEQRAPPTPTKPTRRDKPDTTRGDRQARPLVCWDPPPRQHVCGKSQVQARLPPRCSQCTESILRAASVIATTAG